MTSFLILDAFFCYISRRRAQELTVSLTKNTSYYLLYAMATTTKKEKKTTAAKTSKTTFKLLGDELETVTAALTAVEENCREDEQQQKQCEVTFLLGERQDREMTATEDSVTITSKSEPSKTMTFTMNRWAQFVALLPQIDEEAKELNRKTRPVAYRRHIGDGYYVTVNEGVFCVDIRLFFLPYGMKSGEEKPGRTGIALRLDEWSYLLEFVIPVVHQMFPSLSSAVACYEQEDHLGQLGMMACTSCNPFANPAGWC